MWMQFCASQAQKNVKKLVSSGLKIKLQQWLTVHRSSPRQLPSPFEKLVGDLSGAYSRWVNIHRRLAYPVLETEKVVKISRLWAHY